MISDKIKRMFLAAALGTAALAGAPRAWAQPWTSVDDNTRYLALGDSLSAGFEAKPVTQGFVFQLYQNGVIDNLNNLLFCTEAVPAATSGDILQFQIPQVHLFFKNTGKSYRKVVTLTAGGDDLLTLLRPDGTIDTSLIPAVLTAYANNLAGILGFLAANFPDSTVYVGNIYDPKLPIAGEDLLIAAINQITANVTGFFPNAALVDVFSAFQGRSGLLYSDRHGGFGDIHPTDVGYQVMTQAFSDVIRAHSH